MSFSNSEHDGWIGRNLVPETVVVDEILSNGKGSATGPERALMSALLFDGIQAYLNFVSQSHNQKCSRFREAVSWVHRRGNGYIFSFDNVCECLGIDPEYLRAGLASLSPDESREWSKLRRVS